MNPFLPALLVLLPITTAVLIAAFHRGRKAPADWREDWPEWLENAVCLLPETGSSK
jgi:hypothetical protein